MTIELTTVDSGSAGLAGIQENPANALNIGEDYVLPPKVVLDQAQQFRDQARKWAVNPEDTEVETNKFSAFHYNRKASETLATVVYLRNILNEQINDLQLQVNTIEDSVEKAKNWAERAPNSQVEANRYSARHYAYVAGQILSSLSTQVNILDELVAGNLANVNLIAGQLLVVDIPTIIAASQKATQGLVSAQAILTAITNFNSTASASAASALSSKNAVDVKYAEIVDISKNVISQVTGINFVGRTTQSILMGTGLLNVTLTVNSRIGFVPAAYMTMGRVGFPLVNQSGIMTNWNSDTGILSLLIQQVSGAGTFNDWIISPSIQPTQNNAVLDAGVFIPVFNDPIEEDNYTTSLAGIL